jgi:hypothetical protein
MEKIARRSLKRNSTEITIKDETGMRQKTKIKTTNKANTNVAATSGGTTIPPLRTRLQTLRVCQRIQAIEKAKTNLPIMVILIPR